MFDWRKEVRRYERILRTEFPRECPVCKKEMETGYLTGMLTKFVERGVKKRPLVDPVLMPDMRFHKYMWRYSIMPGYDCAGCGLLLVKYNLKHRGMAVPAIEERKKLDCCPYCNRDMKKGRIYSVKAGTWWSERIGKWGILRGRKMMIEPLSWWRFVGVSARRCNKCGIVFCRYEIQTIPNFLRRLVLLVAIILPLLMLIFLFAF